MRSGPEGQCLTFRPFFRAALLAVFVASFAGCATGADEAASSATAANTSDASAVEAGVAETGQTEATVSIDEANQSLADELMSVSGITAVGISACDGTPCLKVYVIALTEALDERIPLEFQGYEVVVDESGEIRARRKKK